MTAKLKKSVLLVGPRLKETATGVALGFESLVRGFEEAGVEHHVVDLLMGGEPRRSGGFSLKRAFFSGLIVIYVIFRLLTSRALYKTVSSSCGGFVRDAVMIWFAFLLRRRIVVHLKGGGFKDFYARSGNFMRLLIRSTYNRTDVIVVLGELLREQFDFVDNAEEKVQVIPNGLPNALGDESIQLKTIEQPIHLLYLSNMIASKGFLDVLEASRILVHQGYKIRTHFYGSFSSVSVDDKSNDLVDSPERFKALLESMGMDESCYYGGSVFGEAKENLLKKAHFLILPTNYPWEGQPISIIEALAYGTPVIATNFRGIPELVIDGENGYHVPYQSPDSIARCIVDALENPSRFEAMSLYSRNHFMNNFTRRIHLKRLIACIVNSDEYDPVLL